MMRQTGLGCIHASINPQQSPQSYAQIHEGKKTYMILFMTPWKVMVLLGSDLSVLVRNTFHCLVFRSSVHSMIFPS